MCLEVEWFFALEWGGGLQCPKFSAQTPSDGVPIPMPDGYLMNLQV